MRRLFSLLLVVCFASLLVPTAQSQAVPTAVKKSHFYKSKAWWLGELVIAASVAADYSASAHAIHGGVPEGNVLLGRRPNEGRLIAVGFGSFVFWTGVHASAYELLKNDPSPTWRTASLFSTPFEAALIHGYGASRAIHVCSVSDVCR